MEQILKRIFSKWLIEFIIDDVGVNSDAIAGAEFNSPVPSNLPNKVFKVEYDAPPFADVSITNVSGPKSELHPCISLVRRLFYRIISEIEN